MRGRSPIETLLWIVVFLVILVVLFKLLSLL